MMTTTVVADDGTLAPHTRVMVLLELAQCSAGFGHDKRSAGLVGRVLQAGYFDRLSKVDQEVLAFYASEAMAGRTTPGVTVEVPHSMWEAEDAGMLFPVDFPAEAEGVRDFSEYVMVALYPDASAADAIAAHLDGVTGGQPREELHVTLAYLGHVDDAPELDVVLAAVRRAIEGHDPMAGSIGGLGQFPAGDDGVPVYAPVDVPDLAPLRQDIVDELAGAVNVEHGFTPHMTLGYDVEGVGAVPPTPVAFDAVFVVHGTETVRVPLGGGAPPVAGLSGDWVGV